MTILSKVKKRRWIRKRFKLIYFPRFSGSSKIKILGFIMMNFLFTYPLMAEEKFVWEKIPDGSNHREVQKIIPAQDSIVTITPQAIYQKNNQNNSFQTLAHWPVSIGAVYDAVSDSEGNIYAATDQGVYVSDKQTRSIHQIFSSSNELERICRSVLIDGKTIWIGTDRGLFVGEKNKSGWKRLKGALSQAQVLHLKQDSRFIWSAGTNDVYRIEKKSEQTEKVFSSGFNFAQSHRIEEHFNEEDEKQNITALALEEDLGIIFVASISSIYRSKDSGETWEALPSEHLPLKDITSLSVFSGSENERLLYSLYAGTNEGVFIFRNGNWEQIYRGMEALKINDLSFIDEVLYAATDQGVYVLREEKTRPLANTQQVEMVKAFEPSIQNVHDLAIQYAEVSPEKISNWRRLAKKRAWYPKLTISADGGADRTISDSVYGSSSGGGQQFVGPDDKSVGKDFGWDVSLSWDLADTVWSDAQTSIDSRAKLMVELRDDILDQVTRLYFERRRVQMELSVPGLDETIRIEKEMRLEELTALIDSLTGGKFSQQIQKSYRSM